MKSEQISMQGGGYYNDNSSLQRMAIDKALSLFPPTTSEAGSSVVLADYGSSEGYNTVWLLEKVLKQLPTISSATLVFNDTPFNDFTSLSSTINTHYEELSRDGALKINPLMVPKSHFQQVLPDNFVDAAFSFTALHWLQHTPNYDAATRDRPGVADSARNDLVAFLSARHRELRHGSTLILCMPGQGPIGPSSSLECLGIVIRELSHTYHLSPSAIDRLPMYWRTMEEILSAVSASDGKWNVLGHEMVPMVHPAWPDPSNKRSPGTTEADANETYATAVVGFGMAALSGFLVEDARSNADSQYPGDARFLEDFRSVFKREFLRSYCQEKVGFTYAFVHLQKA